MPGMNGSPVGVGVVKTLIANSALAAQDLQGDYIVSTNTPDLVTPAAGVVKKGYTWVVVGADATFFGVNLQAGDVLTAKIDDPSVVGNWIIVQGNLDQATETVAGVAKIATESLTRAGVDDLTFLPPLKLRQELLITSKVDNILYVSTNKTGATDTRTGLDAHQFLIPFKTIQAAIDAATSGDVIIVTGGYDESLTFKVGVHVHFEAGSTLTQSTPDANPLMNFDGAGDYKVTGYLQPTGSTTGSNGLIDASTSANVSVEIDFVDCGGGDAIKVESGSTLAFEALNICKQSGAGFFVNNAGTTNLSNFDVELTATTAKLFSNTAGNLSWVGLEVVGSTSTSDSIQSGGTSYFLNSKIVISNSNILHTAGTINIHSSSWGVKAIELSSGILTITDIIIGAQIILKGSGAKTINGNSLRITKIGTAVIQYAADYVEHASNNISLYHTMFRTTGSFYVENLAAGAVEINIAEPAFYDQSIPFLDADITNTYDIGNPTEYSLASFKSTDGGDIVTIELDATSITSFDLDYSALFGGDALDKFFCREVLAEVVVADNGTVTTAPVIDLVEGVSANLTGTNFIANASTTLAGVGTAYLTEVYVGDYVTADGEQRRVVAVNADDDLTVDTAFTFASIGSATRDLPLSNTTFPVDCSGFEGSEVHSDASNGLTNFNRMLSRLRVDVTTAAVLGTASSMLIRLTFLGKRIKR